MSSLGGLGVVGFILLSVGLLGRTRRVYSGSRGFTPAHLDVVGFISVCVGSLQCA